MELKSKWKEMVDKACPLPEYPRPQLKRERWQCLNGVYKYALLPQNAERADSFDGEIIVPFSLESSLSGVQKPLKKDESLWYERKFAVPSQWRNDKIILNFGAVDYECRVFVNGKEAGYHYGGYNPFSLDITDLICEKENTLTVKVLDPTNDGNQQKGKQVKKPGGIWYTATSGIWQTVWLEPVSENYIKSLYFTPDIDENRVAFFAETSLNKGEFLLDISLKGEKIASGKVLSGDRIKIETPSLWSPEEPNLYDVKVTLITDGQETDTAETYFAMRKFSTGKDKKGLPRLMLNNKPYFQKGLLDQGYWFESQLTPPCDEAMVYDIEMMKKLGFNMLRKHIKIEPARWYYHCDRLGMIVWQDMVSGGDTNMYLATVLGKVGIKPHDNWYKFFGRESAENRKKFEKELLEMIDNLRFFPSICCWVVFNEAWGQFDSVRLSALVKEKDPARIVDHASGWYDRGAGDLESIHQYIAPLPSPKKKDGRVFVISEYGGYSRIIEGHVFNKKKAFGYQMYKDKESLTKAYRNLIEKQAMPLIPKGLSALVYTQLSDVENEVNGILTYDRQEVKIDEETVKELNAKLVL